MPKHGKIVRLLALGAVACLISGCTTETRDGDTTSFSFALWVPGLVILSGALVFLVGLLVRNKSSRWGWGLMIVGPFVLLVLAPGLFLDKATVNQDRFTLRTGIWFAPSNYEVHFPDLAQIELVEEERTTRRGPKTSYFLLCHRKKGDSLKVHVGDLMKAGAADKILQTAKELGIPILGQQ